MRSHSVRAAVLISSMISLGRFAVVFKTSLHLSGSGRLAERSSQQPVLAVKNNSRPACMWVFCVCKHLEKPETQRFKAGRSTCWTQTQHRLDWCAHSPKPASQGAFSATRVLDLMAESAINPRNLSADLSTMPQRLLTIRPVFTGFYKRNIFW